MASDWLWMDIAFETAKGSPDRSRKTGAVIVSLAGKMLARACNDFPAGVVDTDCRHQRPVKYMWTEHSERAAVYACAAAGYRTQRATLYSSWYPCADCARAIICSGIRRLVHAQLPDFSDPIWGPSFRVAATMLAEAGVVCDHLPGA